MTTALGPLQDPAWAPDPIGADTQADTDTARLATVETATEVAHRQAVEQVVQAMREQLDKPFSLRAMARVALLSPYHFNRVFRSITGVPPHTFLTALRMQSAKKLLLTTQLRVTDVCFSVGYQSIGTFTTRFKELVGTTPRWFRDKAEEGMWGLLGTLVANDDHCRPPVDGQGLTEVVGRVLESDGRLGPTFVGLFRSRTPGGHPAACALLPGPERYRMTSVPDGRYRLMAAGFEWSSDIRDFLLPDDSRVWVGYSGDALDVRGGRMTGNPNVRLHRKRTIDPPIVMSFPTSASLGRSPPLTNAPPPQGI